MRDRHLYALWCDDIRQEVGNKPSFMGVYTAGIVFPALPFTIPRLGAWLSVVSRVDEPLKSVTFRIRLDDGTILAEMQGVVGETRIRPGSTRMHVSGAFLLGPITFPEGCQYVEAVATTEDGDLQGSKLWVDSNPGLLQQMGLSPSKETAQPAPG